MCDLGWVGSDVGSGEVLVEQGRADVGGNQPSGESARQQNERLGYQQATCQTSTTTCWLVSWRLHLLSPIA
jgi:hypothetical protein